MSAERACDELFGWDFLSAGSQKVKVNEIDVERP